MRRSDQAISDQISRSGDQAIRSGDQFGRYDQPISRSADQSIRSLVVPPLF
jgi:hypothetical protein